MFTVNYCNVMPHLKVHNYDTHWGSRQSAPCMQGVVSSLVQRGERALVNVVHAIEIVLRPRQRPVYYSWKNTQQTENIF